MGGGFHSELINGRLWSFSLVPSAVTGGLGFILDVRSATAVVRIDKPCSTLVAAISAAKRYEHPEFYSVPILRPNWHSEPGA